MELGRDYRFLRILRPSATWLISTHFLPFNLRNGRKRELMRLKSTTNTQQLLIAGEMREITVVHMLPSYYASEK